MTREIINNITLAGDLLCKGEPDSAKAILDKIEFDSFDTNDATERAQIAEALKRVSLLTQAGLEGLREARVAILESRRLAREIRHYDPQGRAKVAQFNRSKADRY